MRTGRGIGISGAGIALEPSVVVAGADAGFGGVMPGAFCTVLQS